MPFVKDDPNINREGRPIGRVSIKAKIIKHLEENPKQFAKLVDYYLEDEKMRDLLWKMIDGMPKQQMDLGTEGFLPFTIKIVQDNGTTETRKGC